MIRKTYTKTGRTCRVTFKLAASEALEAERVHVLGDFNDWSPEATPLTARKNGAFSTTASLEAGPSYRFRYLLDGERWLSDAAADAQVPNGLGDLDSVVETARV